MEFTEPTLWAHQEQAYELAKDRDDFAFLFEAGTGKTLTTIKVLRYKYAQAKDVLSTLILAPLITLENWRREWLKYSKIPENRVVVLSGNTIGRVAALEKMLGRFDGKFIAITNYEGLVSSSAFYKAIQKWGPKVLVIDESQRIKNSASKRTKLVIDLADRADFRYLLSGTPILNSPMDIFAQWRALDGGKGFGLNFFSFRARYFYDRNANMPVKSHFPNWQLRPEANKELNSIIYKNSLRAIKSECLDLPPFVKQEYFVELSPQQKKHYKEMKDHFLTFIENKAVVANIALTKMLRMLQIISGFIKDEDGTITHLSPNPRLDALEEILEDLTPNHKVLVWAVFRENYEQIRQVLNKKDICYVEAHGQIGTTQKYSAVDHFNNDPEVRVFLGHPGSLGIGINLCPASYAIYYNRTHNLEHDLQSEARNYRGGSEIHESITRIDIIAKDTLDEIILKVLNSKLQNADKILFDIRSYLTSN